MPIWSYKCAEGHETELIILSINEKPLWNVPCGKCGKLAARPDFEQTAPPNLAGDGFYKPSVGGPIIHRQDPTKLLSDITVKGATFEKA